MDLLAQIQQDLKVAILAPIICALFRFLFIYFFAPNRQFKGHERKWLKCFSYGFWWGMDFNSYVFLFLFILASIPILFIDSWQSIADIIRLSLGTIYFTVLYIAFIGKLIFYYHYKDTYNINLRLGKNADKRNLLDIFFNQNHGWWILISIPMYVVITCIILKFMLSTPVFHIHIADEVSRYIFNALLFLVSIIGFYFFRYGGTFKHRNKPEWDTVPDVVKQDMFFAKACIDDLIALEQVYKMKPNEILQHTDEESKEILKPLLNLKRGSILEHFVRKSVGPKIAKPKKIFLLIGESYGQAPFEGEYAAINVAHAGKCIREKQQVVSIDHFLAGGLISQPSITSLINGIYDVNLELNEKNWFWNHSLPTSLPLQLAQLGYQTTLWYGGSLSWSSLGLFSKGAGFTRSFSAYDICPEGSPDTWLGIYDHIFLDSVKNTIVKENEEGYEFHLIYTTSNHGPYTMPIENYGFNKSVFEAKLQNKYLYTDEDIFDWGTYWYTDYYLSKFVSDIYEIYGDSLIIVTGDHSRRLAPLRRKDGSLVELTLRQELGTAFYMMHRDFTKDMISNCQIGSHMSILPTIEELVAPKGQEYYSLVPSLFDKIDSVVTPYHWIENNHIGFLSDQHVQTLDGKRVYDYDLDYILKLSNAYNEVTGYIVRHI